MLLLAPDAPGPSGDRFSLRGWGPDVRSIDRALAHVTLRGTPRVLCSHGVRDQVLPVDKCGRKGVAQPVAREALDFFFTPSDPKNPPFLNTS